jgi:hypothetical protein
MIEGSWLDRLPVVSRDIPLTATPVAICPCISRLVILLPTSYNSADLTNEYAMRPSALRHHYRFPVFGPVKYESASREGHGTVMNLSSLGWRVSGSLLLEAGDVCALKVKLPTKTWISVTTGKVRWVRGEEFGVETLVMNEESQERLNAYILERIKAL